MRGGMVFCWDLHMGCRRSEVNRRKPWSVTTVSLGDNQRVAHTVFLHRAQNFSGYQRRYGCRQYSFRHCVGWDLRTLNIIFVRVYGFPRDF